MDPEHVRAILGEEPKGIGLSNVDLRMRRIYGHDYGLVVDTAPGAGTKIQLRIPKTRPQPSLI